MCTTEFVAFAQLAPELKKRNVELTGLSIDSVYSHIAWVWNIEEKFGVKIPFPIRRPSVGTGGPMKHHGWILVSALALALLGIALGASGERAAQVPEGWFFTLPAGDAIQGGLVFSKWECYSCHKVARRSFRRPDAGGVGPDFGPAHADLPGGYLAESIVNPNKVIAGEQGRYRAEDGRSSRMRDYTEVMTLRELMDVAAYLKSVR